MLTNVFSVKALIINLKFRYFPTVKVNLFNIFYYISKRLYTNRLNTSFAVQYLLYYSYIGASTWF